MPDDDVWLLQRTAELDALAKVLAAMRTGAGRAVQGAGSPTRPTPVSMDLSRHRKAEQ